MTKFPLIQNQLSPPKIKNYITRKGLYEFSRNILTHRLTTVVAPAGYGKSVWMASLTEDPNWPPTAWLSLVEHDTEPSYLLYHLIHALKKVWPDFGEEALLTMHSVDDPSRDFLIALSSIIEDIPLNNDIVVVIDDLHLLDNSEKAINIISYLVRWLPDNVHIVLMSRHHIPMALHRERLNEQLLEIHSEALRFSIAETKELLDLIGLKLNENDINSLYNLTEGWVASLRLAGIVIKQNPAFSQDNLLNLTQKYSDLYNYLSSEFLSSLTLQLQDFLLDTSLLPYLEKNLCQAVLNCNNCEDTLKQLHNLGLISLMYTDNYGTWRLHRLMNDYLTEKVLEKRSADYIYNIRKRAAYFLEEKGDIESALVQIGACGNWPAVCELIQKHGNQYFMQNGRLDALSGWISRLPEELVERDEQLLYYKGMSILHINSEEALDILSTAAELASEKGNIKCQIRSLIAMLAAYTFANNLEQIKKTAKRIPVAASLIRDNWSRGVILVAGLGRSTWDDHLQRGLWFSRIVGKIKLEPEMRMAYLFYSCIIQFRLGNLSQALNLIEEALSMPYVRDSERWLGTAYEIYTAALVYAGDHPKIIEVCYELLRLGLKYNVPHQLAFGHRHLACVYIRERKLAEARREFELARNYFREANNVYVAYLTELETILLRTEAGELAGDLFSEAKNILHKMLALPGGQGFDDNAMALAGVIAREAGNLEDAEKYLSDSLARSTKKGAKQIIASVQLHLARLYQLKGDENKADDFLLKALSTAEACQFENFSIWHTNTFYIMFSRALMKGIHVNWASQLLRRWFAEQTIQEIFFLLDTYDDNLRSLICGLLIDNAKETGKPQVHVKFLGDFRIYINGTEILANQWKTQKAISLFKYLIINKRSLAKEEIIEQLWPEADLQAGDASLRMALSHIRKALSLEIIRSTRGMISINSNINLYTDYELFELLIQKVYKNKSMNESLQIETLEKALLIYKGDFLVENLYDDWANSMRDHLYNQYLKALLKLAQLYLKKGKISSAIQICRRYLSYEPVDEKIGRLTMEIYWESGQKQQAIEIFQDISKTLKKEYGATPSSETKLLYEKIIKN